MLNRILLTAFPGGLLFPFSTLCSPPPGVRRFLSLHARLFLAFRRKASSVHHNSSLSSPPSYAHLTAWALAYITECNHFFGINLFLLEDSEASGFQFLQPERVPFSSKFTSPESLLLLPTKDQKKESQPFSHKLNRILLTAFPGGLLFPFSTLCSPRRECVGFFTSLPPRTTLSSFPQEGLQCAP